MFQLISRNLYLADLYTTSPRYLRMRAMRDKHLPKLIKGKVETMKDDYVDFDTTIKSMSVEPDDIQRELDLESCYDYTGVIKNIDQAYDIHKRDEQATRNIIRKHILKRNFFKEPSETNLLTHAAKIQLRYLHFINPEEWTPERLAECFPVSVSGVKKLLKCTSVSLEKRGKEAIKCHDEEVAKRWKCLKANENLSQFSPITLKLWKEGRIVQDFYSGNPALPQPEILEEHVITKPKKVGEFESMVKKYVDIKKEKNQKSLSVLNEEKINEPEKISESKDDKMLKDICMKPLSQKNLEDETSETYLATNQIDPTEPDVLIEQFQENLIEEYSDKKNKTSAEIEYYEWMKEKQSLPLSKNSNVVQPYDSKNVVTKIKKFNSDVVELTTESKVPYLYNSNQGYQYPFGRDAIRYKINIPKKMYKKGAVFKVGQAFYNDRGFFMYKIPLEINVK